MPKVSKLLRISKHQQNTEYPGPIIRTESVILTYILQSAYIVEQCITNCTYSFVEFILFKKFYFIILLFILASDLFGECYSNSEDRAYALLVRKTMCWNQTTVLNLATEADAKSFFAHDGVQVTARIPPLSHAQFKNFCSLDHHTLKETFC